jgi:hypothetical protein
MMLFRERPHWCALIFEYGVGVVATWHLVEDLLQGQGKVYSGEFYPCRQLVDMNSAHYSLIVLVEGIALALFFFRIQTRFAAAAVAAALVVDNLGSYLNHRSLMAVEFFAISLLPAPAPWRVAADKVRVYWNLDLARLQLTLLYASSALHKLNEQFLSGRTLHNLFWMTHEHGLKTYPEWLRALLDQLSFCQALAWTTIAVELSLAIGLNFQKTARPCIAVAILFHVTMAVLMAYIKIFSTLMIVSLIVFWPHKVREDSTPTEHIRQVGRS